MIVPGIFIILLALLLSSEAKAGTGVDFTVINGTQDTLVIEFADRQNCLEPAVLAGFIGSSITLEGGQSWTRTIYRRNGHGCDGDNAIFWGRPLESGKSYSETGFGLSGDGAMVITDRASDYTSLFAQSDNGASFTWQLEMTSVADGQPSDAEKIALLRQHAPEIWLARDERFFPSSVEWAFPFLDRVQRDGRFWLYTRQELNSPSDDSLALFHGDVKSASVYAFWVSGKAGGVIDLVYFTYYPYNRGKQLMDTVWGNHIGDWENMVVRLNSSLQAERVFLSQHDGDQNASWAGLQKNASGHPVVYAAWGSHGLYPSAGNHQYQSTEAGPLIDATSQGTQWNTWDRLEAIDFEKKRGLGNSDWPRWMDVDYIVGETGNPGTADPASGAIFRWGNGENGCAGALPLSKKASGECRLNDGPTGPIDKNDRWEKNVHCFGGNYKTPLWRTRCRNFR